MNECLQGQLLKTFLKSKPVQDTIVSINFYLH